MRELHTDYLKDRFNNTRDKWKYINFFNNNNKQHPTSSIVDKGKVITSPKLIAQMCNNQ